MPRSSGLRPFVAVGALLAAGVALGASAPAHAAGETCDGKPATLVFAGPPPSGTHTYEGTGGDDVIVVTYPQSGSVDAGAGDDTVCGANGISGGEGNDDLWGLPTSQGVFLSGGAGDDVLHGTAGDDTLAGGSGDDTLLGGSGQDSLAGDELVTPTTAPARDDDTIDAGPGKDGVIDDWGNDTLAGGTGRLDRLTLGVAAADPSIDGCSPAIPTHATLDVGAGTVSGFGTDTFQGFEIYGGGTRTSTLIGTRVPTACGPGSAARPTCAGAAGPTSCPDCRWTEAPSAAAAARTGSPSGAYGAHGGSGNDRVQLEPNDLASLFFSESRAVRGQIWGGTGVDRIVDDSHTMLGIDLRHGLQGRRSTLPVHGVEDARVNAPLRADRYYMVGTSGHNVLATLSNIVRLATPVHTVLRGLGGNDRLLGGPHDAAYGGPGRDLCQAQTRVGCEVS